VVNPKSSFKRPMIWPAEDIWQSCAPLLPALTVEVLREVDSTNSELMRRAQAGNTDPVLLIAENQTAGRGRLGRQWHGQAGDALTFSLGLVLHPVDWSGLSLAVGLSVVESLDPKGDLGLGLKWPNDVWTLREPKRWEKLAGILIETAVTRNKARYCVIGIGVNLAKPGSTDLSIPAAGLRELRENISAPQALASIAKPLLSTVLAFETKGFDPLQTAFAQRDVLFDLPVTLSDGRQGIARGVDNTGVLRVETSQGLELIHSAEVRVRPSTE
jgi:BirA family biotin operon repressor/biotin-[acetyl-CoA-carboxylase] ligase